MSTKTILNRIAKVAVAALLGGFLTVVSAPLANATAGDIDIVAPGSTVSGICSITNGDGDFETVGGTYVSTLNDPHSVTMAVGGVLLLDVESTHIVYSSNGVLAGSTFDTAPYLNSDYAVYYGVDNDTVTFTANAVGTATVSSYAAAPFSAANTAAAGLSAGANGSLTVTVVAACASTGYSDTYSQYRVDNTAFAAGNANLLKTYGDTLTFGAGEDAFISIIGKNSYDTVLPSTTTWTASATNGAKVLFGTSSTSIGAVSTARGTLSSTSTTAAGTAVYVRVNPADRAAGGTTTVTVTAGGSTVLTRTLTFLPEASKLVITKQMSGVIGGEGAFTYRLETASGTVVPGSISGRSATLDSRVTSTTSIKSATIAAATSTATTINGVAATTIIGSVTSNGIMKYACNVGTTTGSTTVTFRHTTPVSETVIDTPVKLDCAGGMNTYTISLDKASYKIGEVATLTVSAKDTTGAAVNDFTVIGTGATISVGGGSLVKALNDGALGTGDQFTSGTKTYQIQMTTAGAFNTVVNFPGLTTKSQTVGYTVADGSGAVTNAEVLAAIVKLIASINKQIAKLQKLIKK